MANYYFVGTLLPSLSFDTPPEMTFEQLEELLKDNLSEKDFEKTLVIRQFYDLLNLRSLWLEEDLDFHGEMSELELSDAQISGVGLPDYVYQFLENYPKEEQRLQNFPFLLARFFKKASEGNDPFLHAYFQFEREMRLVLTAFRAKKLGKDLSVELQYEDPEEELISQLLSLQDAKNYEPPEKFHALKVLFDKFGMNPLTLEKALDEYRFEKIENLVDWTDVFSIDRLLAYLLQFILVEKWSQLDQTKGSEIIRSNFKTQSEKTLIK